MANVFIPAGRLSTKRREFRSVVADLRHAVFAVVRFRPADKGLYEIMTLGSGFFVSSEVFVTCCHVLNSLAHPHKSGDTYKLVNNLGPGLISYDVGEEIGKDIHLFPDRDFAIMLCRQKKDQAFLSISYADIPVGCEIGVAGYPLATLFVDSDGNPDVSRVVYRVAKGVATAVFSTNLDMGLGHPMPNTPVVEVNFLFVPGNSGGPIFDAETGRVCAYVEGFNAHKIKEHLQECYPTTEVPEGLSTKYLDCVHAVYSIGLTLGPVRKELEQFGVKL